MSHPFQFIPADNYVQVFLPLLALTLLLAAVLSAIPLKPDIVQFELNALKVIKSWKETDKMWAAFSLGLDFLFLVVYSTTIGLACVWLANVLQAYSLPLATVGIWLAWGQWVAALLDMVENIALTIILVGSVRATLPQLAKWSAIFKFGLIILGLLYAAVGGIIWVKLSWV
ncbi:hypothetical protein H6F74_14750 [Trichocoleus sp. FACHB-90]|uniref:hypothetical protein n=1 Tax=Cyanophyceae TaxID=3028117 RepID=UPI001689D5B9|nr:hypothetical protein [Trichocoleus sp. FACHB-90]MBD1927492.1 hypothetical protein [Trichocoleus sp. FACHB-90]